MAVPKKKAVKTRSYKKDAPKKKTPAKKATKPPGFRTSFAAAKKAGKKTFTWNGKSYNTTTASEKAKKMSDKELYDAEGRSQGNSWNAQGVEGKPKSKSLQKSTKEIHKSYKKESNKRNTPKKK